MEEGDVVEGYYHEYGWHAAKVIDPMIKDNMLRIKFLGWADIFRVDKKHIRLLVTMFSPMFGNFFADIYSINELLLLAQNHTKFIHSQ